MVDKLQTLKTGQESVGNNWKHLWDFLGCFYLLATKAHTDPGTAQGIYSASWERPDSFRYITANGEY